MRGSRIGGGCASSARPPPPPSDAPPRVSMPDVVSAAIDPPPPSSSNPRGNAGCSRHCHPSNHSTQCRRSRFAMATQGWGIGHSNRGRAKGSGDPAGSRVRSGQGVAASSAAGRSHSLCGVYPSTSNHGNQPRDIRNHTVCRMECHVNRTNCRLSNCTDEHRNVLVEHWDQQHGNNMEGIQCQNGEVPLSAQPAAASRPIEASHEALPDILNSHLPPPYSPPRPPQHRRTATRASSLFRHLHPTTSMTSTQLVDRVRDKACCTYVMLCCFCVDGRSCNSGHLCTSRCILAYVFL